MDQADSDTTRKSNRLVEKATKNIQPSQPDSPESAVSVSEFNSSPDPVKTSRQEGPDYDPNDSENPTANCMYASDGASMSVVQKQAVEKEMANCDQAMDRCIVTGEKVHHFCHMVEQRTSDSQVECLAGHWRWKGNFHRHMPLNVIKEDPTVHYMTDNHQATPIPEPRVIAQIKSFYFGEDSPNKLLALEEYPEGIFQAIKRPTKGWPCRMLPLDIDLHRRISRHVAKKDPQLKGVFNSTGNYQNHSYPYTNLNFSTHAHPVTLIWHAGSQIANLEDGRLEEIMQVFQERGARELITAVRDIVVLYELWELKLPTVDEAAGRTLPAVVQSTPRPTTASAESGYTDDSSETDDTQLTPGGVVAFGDASMHSPATDDGRVGAVISGSSSVGAVHSEQASLVHGVSAIEVPTQLGEKRKKHPTPPTPQGTVGDARGDESPSERAARMRKLAGGSSAASTKRLTFSNFPSAFGGSETASEPAKNDRRLPSIHRPGARSGQDSKDDDHSMSDDSDSYPIITGHELQEKLMAMQARFKASNVGAGPVDNPPVPSGTQSDSAARSMRSERKPHLRVEAKPILHRGDLGNGYRHSTFLAPMHRGGSGANKSNSATKTGSSGSGQSARLAGSAQPSRILPHQPDSSSERGTRSTSGATALSTELGRAQRPLPREKPAAVDPFQQTEASSSSNRSAHRREGTASSSHGQQSYGGFKVPDIPPFQFEGGRSQHDGSASSGMRRSAASGSVYARDEGTSHGRRESGSASGSHRSAPRASTSHEHEGDPGPRRTTQREGDVNRAAGAQALSRYVAPRGQSASSVTGQRSTESGTARSVTPGSESHGASSTQGRSVHATQNRERDKAERKRP
ncbi:hypothetical protein R3P38DRAFT_3282926 [Favolaschia claudopus]|uniref:Uncharacterized protein n=1 Tax=Favolaschia claudopus TaxID=2862362 RepID=A0AAW0A9G9_9AGAR